MPSATEVSAAASAPSRPQRVTSVGPGLWHRMRQEREAYLLIAPAILLLLTIFVAPALYNLWISLRDVSLFELSQGGDFVGLDNYAELLRDPTLGRVLFNTSFWLTAVTVVLRMALGLGVAMLLNSAVLRRLRILAPVRTAIMVPWVIPPVIAVAIWTWLMQPRYGLVNQLLVQVGLIEPGTALLAGTTTVWPALVAIIVWRELPLVALMYLAGLQAIPGDLYEAARVDGASRPRMFRSLTLPLLRPVSAVVALLTTIWTFNNFVYVWLTTGGGPGEFTHVLATFLYREGFVSYEMGKGAAVGMVMTAVMLVFAVVYFVRFLRPELDDD